jgi:hypothetical protein
MNAICSSRLRGIFPLASSTSTVAFVADAPVADCPAGRAAAEAKQKMITAAQAQIAVVSFENFDIDGILQNSEGKVSSVKRRYKMKVYFDAGHFRMAIFEPRKQWYYARLELSGGENACEI